MDVISRVEGGLDVPENLEALCVDGTAEHPPKNVA
jgi:hypothetical protein